MDVNILRHGLRILWGMDGVAVDVDVDGASFHWQPMHSELNFVATKQISFGLAAPNGWFQSPKPKVRMF